METVNKTNGYGIHSEYTKVVCSGIAKNAKNACAKSLGTVHDVYNEGEPSVGLFV